MKTESADQFHDRFKKRVVYMALVAVGCIIVPNWNELFRFVDDLSTPEGRRWILVRLSVSGILYLLLLILMGTAARMALTVKRNAQISSVFHDEFHDLAEKKAVLFSWYVTNGALVVLTVLGVVTSPNPAFSAALTAQIALVLSLVSFVGSYLFYDREQ